MARFNADPPRLSDATLRERRGGVVIPEYDRARLRVGQLHLGLGAFHRAHQAVYTDAALAAGHLQWGVAAVAMRSRGPLQALREQDRLYTLIERGGERDRTRILGSLAQALHFQDDRAALWEIASDPGLKIVTLTVTEKGYGHRPATRGLDRSDPLVAADLAAPGEKVGSVVGFLAQLARVRRRIGAPLTVLCCDNMERNGETLRALVLEMAEAWDPTLRDWIAMSIAFPNCMVDRITPAQTEETMTLAYRLGGFEDAAALETEPFTQWVMEDRFAAGRPPWELGGAQFVRDIGPWQRMKLALLNGPHSALAYLGQLAGFETIGDAMAEPALAGFAEALMRDEILPAIAPPAETDPQSYIADLLERFRNPKIRHRTEQIAMDGSQKVPVRWLPVIEAARKEGRTPDRLCFALAAWFVYLAGRSEGGAALALNDPLAARLSPLAQAEDADAMVAALMAETAVFPMRVAADETLKRAVAAKVRAIREKGVLGALAAA